MLGVNTTPGHILAGLCFSGFHFSCVCGGRIWLRGIIHSGSRSSASEVVEPLIMWYFIRPLGESLCSLRVSLWGAERREAEEQHHCWSLFRLKGQKHWTQVRQFKHTNCVKLCVLAHWLYMDFLLFMQQIITFNPLKRGEWLKLTQGDWKRNREKRGNQNRVMRRSRRRRVWRWPWKHRPPWMSHLLPNNSSPDQVIPHLCHGGTDGGEEEEEEEEEEEVKGPFRVWFPEFNNNNDNFICIALLKTGVYKVFWHMYNIRTKREHNTKEPKPQQQKNS